MSRIISLAVKNASAMQAYVAAPHGEGPFPAVIVCHDAFGVNAQVRDIVDALARAGFVAVAPEFFHRTAPGGFEARPYQVSLVMPHVNAIKSEQLADDLAAIYKWLIRQNNVNENSIGALGFSLGGKFAFIAHALLGLRAGVSFYGGMLHKETDKIKMLKGAQLFIWAGSDEHIKREHIQAVTEAMRAAGKDFSSIEIARAKHGFFFDGHPGYDAAAAGETWAFVKEFLRNKLA